MGIQIYVKKSAIMPLLKDAKVIQHERISTCRCNDSLTVFCACCGTKTYTSEPELLLFFKGLAIPLVDWDDYVYCDATHRGIIRGLLLAWFNDNHIDDDSWYEA